MQHQFQLMHKSSLQTSCNMDNLQDKYYENERKSTIEKLAHS